MKAITKARIADAAIAYITASERYDNAITFQPSTPDDHKDDLMHAMYDTHEALSELVFDWNRWMEAKNR